MTSRMFTIKQLTDTPTLKYELSPAVDLTGATVAFTMADENGVKVLNSVAAGVEQTYPPIVYYSFTTAQTATSGLFDAEFKVTFPNGDVAVYPGKDYLKVNIVPIL